MVFTSPIFLFYFLPTCLLVYAAWPRRFRNLFLTLASYFFYAWWNPWFVCLMFFTTFTSYIASRMMFVRDASSRTRKTALVVSLCANLGLLAVFKYAMFAQENLNVLLQMLGANGFQILKITLPIGISFYCLQSVGYTIDIYRRTTPPAERFVDFACFVSLFPQLIAGPIVRYGTVAQQLKERKPHLAQFASGVALFIAGFAKKILLANPAGAIADSVFSADHPAAWAAWAGVVAFALQIYFDFSGYSDMAVGLGRLLGFEFPKNFDSPYRAESITDFWRRWHISLSTFLRDYLYIPLGGGRNGRVRTYVNLALVMLLGGLWHGAHWQFVVWGGFHGSLLILERIGGKRSCYAAFPRPFRVGFTFILILVSWVWFRADSLSAAVQYLGVMFGCIGASPTSGLLAGKLLSATPLLILGLGLLLAMSKVQASEALQELSWAKALGLVLLFLLALAAMSAQTFNPFLYFQF